tara:strand:+ start:18363 stop:19151 length:789 start_codon:yes stop_codon:yes gene_type:complete
MELPCLKWESLIYQDPDGGKIVIWPHLPCVVMPNSLRYKKWDGLALLYSKDDITILKQEHKDEIKSPGINVDAVMASGGAMSLLLRDIQNLDVNGPSIPDPEPIRLLKHAENTGGKPIYTIIPEITDKNWEAWYSKYADNQVKLINLLKTISTSRRYVKNRLKASKKVEISEKVNSDLGAAAAAGASWWIEEQRVLTEELIEERDQRFAARIKGALHDLRDRRLNESNDSDVTLLVPVHQAYLEQLYDSLNKSVRVEKIERG